MAREPEPGAGSSLTSNSVCHPGQTRTLPVFLRSVGPTFILLVGKFKTVLILPTIFRCAPFKTTKEQNTVHLPGVKACKVGI